MSGPEHSHRVCYTLMLQAVVDFADGTPVIALFVLVPPLLFQGGAFCTKGSKEQILANGVPGMVDSGSVHIPLGTSPPSDVT